MKSVGTLLLATFLLPFFLVSCLQSPEPAENDDEHESVERDEAPGKAEGAERENNPTKSAPEPEKKSFTELREERKALEKKWEELETLAGNEGSLIEREVVVSDELELLRGYAAMLESHSAELDQGLGEWRNATRKSFVGVQLSEIATSDGRTFQNVTIEKVEDETVAISHDGGSDTIEILSLPLELRKNLIHEATVLATRNQ